MIPDWYPDHPPIYDIHKTYTENAEQGPFFSGAIPKRHPVKPVDFLGFEINSPIGVPAGPLLNARWIALAAKLGYDVPTYKTIRSYAHPSHALPNVVYVKPVAENRAVAVKALPEHLEELSITNSFGNPSKSPDFLLEDIAKANASLGKGQVMIVSVYGTPDQGVSLADDFVRAAVLAREAGAKIVEANFSCPNVEKAGGCLYMSAGTVLDFVRKLKGAVGTIPLLIKVGLFENEAQMRDVFLAAARGGADGICGINTISMEVVDAQGHAALGEKRRTGGVCGGSIRKRALDFMHQASRLIKKEKLGLTLLGCGGIAKPEHFEEFLAAGASIAMTATGMMWDPYLALRYHERSHHEPKAARS